MPLKPSEIKTIRKELDMSVRPLYFFHDDADGLASFLLLYRYIKEGQGVVVKAIPNVDDKFIRKAVDYGADTIFIVDLAQVEQEFINKVKSKIVWIDHHTPVKRNNVSYFNPRVHKSDEITSNSYLCYQVVQQDLWVAMAGAIGDWTFPEDLVEEFRKEYEDLLPSSIKTPDAALFETDIGKLSRIFTFILKGKTHEALECAKVLTRINSPYEILRQETAAGKFVHKRFTKINKSYEGLLKEAAHSKAEDGVLLYTYDDSRMSFTGELSNELLYRNTDKVIIVARQRSGEFRCSLRSGKNLQILPILENALVGVEGYGGGHEHACGASVKEEDFDRFLDSIKKQLPT